jgi:hypothetical protein
MDWVWVGVAFTEVAPEQQQRLDRWLEAVNRELQPGFLTRPSSANWQRELSC